MTLPLSFTGSIEISSWSYWPVRFFHPFLSSFFVYHMLLVSPHFGLLGAMVLCLNQYGIMIKIIWHFLHVLSYWTAMWHVADRYGPFCLVLFSGLLYYYLLKFVICPFYAIFSCLVVYWIPKQGFLCKSNTHCFSCP